MTMLYYLLEVNIYILIFYGLYKALFEGNTFYQANRYYLLASLPLAFLMPLFDLSGIFLSTGATGEGGYAGTGQTETLLPVFLQVAYFSGISVMVLRFLFRLGSLYTLIRKGEQINCQGYRIVLIDELDQAFSFMTYLFVNPRLRHSEMILLHEQVHIKQKHSIDLIFLDIVQALNWFNPMIGLVRNELRILHEYIADKITTEKIDPSDYAMFLISNTCESPPVHLGSYMFNQSNLKKRIMKLKQEKTGSWAWLRYLGTAALLPLTTVAASMSFARDYAVVRINHQTETVLDTITPKQAASGKRNLMFPAPVLQEQSSVKPTPVVKPLKYNPPTLKKLGKMKPPPVISKSRKMDPPPPPPVDPNKVKADENEAPPPPPVDPFRKNKND